MGWYGCGKLCLGAGLVAGYEWRDKYSQELRSSAVLLLATHPSSLSLRNYLPLYATQ